MKDLFSQLFKKGTLVELKLSDGKIINGIVSNIDDGSIHITENELNDITITPEMLTKAIYLYIGYPTRNAEKDVPLKVQGNGIIEEFDGTQGFLNDRLFINLESFLNNNLKDLGKKNPEKIVGVDVLYVLRTDKYNIKKAYILEASTLNAVLDSIAELSGKGKIEIAKDFCEILLRQYPENKDVCMFMKKLMSPDDTEDDVDYYKPILSEQQIEMYVKNRQLIPQGRIVEMGKNSGFIIDINSHEKLFFFKGQLIGDLEELSAKDLIGQPVVYSVSWSKDGKSYQARSVMRPMRFTEAYNIAEDMHWEEPSRSLNACDILRIILQQYEDVNIEETLGDWVRKKTVSDGLWPIVTPPQYIGQPEEYKLKPRKTSTCNIVLKRSLNHTISESGYSEPIRPHIIFGEIDKPSVEKYEKNAPQPSLEDTIAEEQMDHANIAEKEFVYSVKGIAPESIDKSDSAYLQIEPNALLTYRYGNHFIQDIKDNDFLYEITQDDIIDEDLLKEAKRNESSTNYISRKPVVCQLIASGKPHAAFICYPAKVADMLKSAIKICLNADKMDASEYSYAEIHDEYKRAQGFVENVLSFCPNNTIAIKLKYVIDDTLEVYDDSCHKAPLGVKPMGILTNNDGYKIDDYRFKESIPFSLSDIVDNGYKVRRQGDELMYAIYENENGKKTARFVHRAKPEVDLINMAQYFSDTGYLEKAWGIAMNILDVNPLSRKAKEIAERCSEYVDENTKTKRELPVINDLYASANKLARSKDKDSQLEAIHLYTQEIETSKNHERRVECIRRSIQLYSDMYNSNPLDNDIRRAYNLFGRRYIDGNEINGFWLTNRNNLNNLYYIILFYEDMDDTEGLIKAYNEQIRLLNTLQNLSDEDKKEKIAQARADIAWTYIRTNQHLGKAEKLTQEALDGSNNGNERAQICKAILEYRNDKSMKSLRDKISFSDHAIEAYRGWLDEVHPYTGFGEQFDLDIERFGLLCRIITLQKQNILDEKDVREKYLRYLARYISTLICKKNDYYKELQLYHELPGDCWLVQQLSKCIQKGVIWSHWSDIRLISMLSTESAYIICVILYNLNKHVILGVLRESGINYEYKNVHFSLYAKGFNSWRGDAYHSYYKNLREKTRGLVNNTNDLSRCATFFRELKHESWMQQSDNQLILMLHQQLPTLITEFGAENNSRSIITAYQILGEQIDDWLKYIKSHPTVLSITIVHYLLNGIKNITKGMFKKIQFCPPEAHAQIVSTSMANPDGTIMFEVQVENRPEKAYPMKDCKLSFINSEQIVAIDYPQVYKDASNVFGGEDLIYILRAKLSSIMFGKKECPIRLCFQYNYEIGNRKGTESKELDINPIPIKMWDPQATVINNIYSVGTVATDDSQFFGRDEKVSDVVSVIDTPHNMPHYFIYGQKRSGKSSMLYHIRKRLAQLNRYICVDMDFLTFSVNKEDDIYYNMLKKVQGTIKWKYNIEAKKEPDKEPLPLFDMPTREECSIDVFCHCLDFLINLLSETKGWEKYKIVFFIDEFTSAYKWYKQGLIDKDFFTRWKSLQSDNLFSAVLIGQDVLRSISDVTAPNNLAGFCFMKLDYLQPEDARRIITEPIISLTGNQDIFVGNAVDRILYYSASSAYYTKWICHELIEYIKSNRLDVITEADVEASIRRALNGDSTELKILFDPLEFSGQDPIESEYSKEQTREILLQVARGELNDSVKGCHSSLITSESVNVVRILDDLVKRDVLIEKNNYYKLKVKLYLLWTFK